MAKTAALAEGPIPTTIAIFDDAAAVATFCTRHADACAPRSRLVRSHLEGLLGEAAYREARQLLTSAQKPVLNPYRCRGANPLPLECRGCRWRSVGRTYQSLKKFYGVAAAHAPGCRFFLVSDAESYPFRTYDFAALAAHTIRMPPPQTAAGLEETLPGEARQKQWGRDASIGASTRVHRPFTLMNSWYPNQHGCTSGMDMHTDGSCAELTGRLLGLQGSWSTTSGGGLARAYQTLFSYNDWWLYERGTARWMIARTERVSEASHAIEPAPPKCLCGLKLPPALCPDDDLRVAGCVAVCLASSPHTLSTCARHVPHE